MSWFNSHFNWTAHRQICWTQFCWNLSSVSEFNSANYTIRPTEPNQIPYIVVKECQHMKIWTLVQCHLFSFFWTPHCPPPPTFILSVPFWKELQIIFWEASAQKILFEMRSKSTETILEPLTMGMTTGGRKLIRLAMIWLRLATSSTASMGSRWDKREDRGDKTAL